MQEYNSYPSGSRSLMVFKELRYLLWVITVQPQSNITKISGSSTIREDGSDLSKLGGYLT